MGQILTSNHSVYVGAKHVIQVPLNLSTTTTTAAIDTTSVEVDTNVFVTEIATRDDFKPLALQTTLIAPILCQQCSAAFNRFSVINEKNQWTCEFCGGLNEIPLARAADVKIIQSDAVIDYLAASSSTTTTTTATTYSGMMTRLRAAALKEVTHTETIFQPIIFCIDISGSMAGTRLEGIKKALKQQLTDLHNTKPEQCVGLLVFEASVRYFDMGTNKWITFSFDMNNVDAIRKCVETRLDCYVAPLSRKYDTMISALALLTTGGNTALGPAMVAALAIVSKTPGSRVLLATDGCANAGVGGLEYYPAGSINFYTELADYAITNQSSVSILTFEGTYAALDVLTVITERTGGIVETLSATTMATGIGKMLFRETLATNVIATYILHPCLQFRYSLDAIDNVMVEQIGLVSMGSASSFEFHVKEGAVIPAVIPIQANYAYKMLDGSQAVRIVTRLLIPEERIEKMMLVATPPMFVDHAIRACAKLAQMGNYRAAQLRLRACTQFMHELATPIGPIERNYLTEISALEETIRTSIPAEDNTTIPVLLDYAITTQPYRGPRAGGVRTLDRTVSSTTSYSHYSRSIPVATSATTTP